MRTTGTQVFRTMTLSNTTFLGALLALMLLLLLPGNAAAQSDAARIMGARYPYYLLIDSHDGVRKEAEVSGRAVVDKPTHGNVRHGFVYERVPHITLKSIANNAEIDIIYESHQPKVQAGLNALNAALRGHKTPFRVTTGGREGKDVRFDAGEDAAFTMSSGEVLPASALVEWEVPREAPADWPAAAKKQASRKYG